MVLLPVSNIGRGVEFYCDKHSFHLDHNTLNEHMHVAQLAPPGSGCSIVLVDLPAHQEMVPGSLRALQLEVSDAQAAQAELLSRGRAFA